MKANASLNHHRPATMIIPGHRAWYLATRGKLAHRAGQIVTILVCHRTQILVRFPDGSQSHTHRRHLQPVSYS